jgi:signal transduction histidine kinase
MMNQRLRLAGAEGTGRGDGGGQRGGVVGGSVGGVSVHLNSGLKTIGYLSLEGGMSGGPGSERFLLSRLNRAALTAGLIAGGVSLFVALLLAYRLLRPVRELTHAAGQLAKGDLSQRVPVRGDDELAGLGRTFNRMADSLQQAKESRRAMTADIAHELRNPLAVQRANLEALQDGIYPLTPENLDPILEQNLLLSHMVDDLRTLALADAGQLALERIPTDFPALVRHLVERFEPQASSRKIHLNLILPQAPPATITHLRVDPLRIEQITNNLLSNAVRYTPEGGSITITLSHSAAAVQLIVKDSGPGIPVEALPHIFERFYRAERSRSRSEGGSGLGLAIARQLAGMHGGSLEAANDPQGGAVFTLTLPTEDAA